MPHYFFNTRIGDDMIPDPDGEELRDPDHAWEVARTMIQEIPRDQRGQPNLLTASLKVTDQHGEVVLAFPFSEALIAPPDDRRRRISATVPKHSVMLSIGAFLASARCWRGWLQH